jgi:hypothetical protein
MAANFLYGGADAAAPDALETALSAALSAAPPALAPVQISGQARFASAADVLAAFRTPGLLPDEAMLVRVLNVRHGHLHDLAFIKTQVHNTTGAVIESKVAPDSRSSMTRFIVKSRDAQAVMRAVSALKKVFSPLRIAMTSPQALFVARRHITPPAQCQALEKAFGVRIHAHSLSYGKGKGQGHSAPEPIRVQLQVFGPTIALGAFSAKLRSFFDEAEQAVCHIPIPRPVPFRQQKYLRQKFAKGFPGSQLFFRPAAITGEYLPQQMAKATRSYDAFETSFIQAVSELCGTLPDARCVGCDSRSQLVLYHCGCSICSLCLSGLCADPANATICCPGCQTPVSIRDILAALPDKDSGEQMLLTLAKRQMLRNPAATWSVCPACDTFQPRTGSYKLCASCSHGWCDACGSESIAHAGLSCDSLRQHSGTVASFIEKIFARCDQFARDNWTADVAPITDIHLNPGLMSGCPSMLRFAACAQEEDGPLDPDKLTLAFHGSHDHVLPNICHDGFDPHRRSGQAYGAGEYFGTNLKTSLGYTYNNLASASGRRSGRIIIAAIIPKHIVKHVPDFCYVVGNDVMWTTAANLPVCIVSFGTDAPKWIDPPSPPVPVRMLPAPPLLIGEPMTAAAPARWKWQDGDFYPYTEDVSAGIEARYQAFMAGSISPYFVAENVTRLLDDRKDDYVVDLSTMKQKNRRTGWERLIRRDLVPLDLTTTLAENAVWQFQREDAMWQSYDSLLQTPIQVAYENYLRGGDGFFKTHFPGRPEEYVLNFATVTQRNTTSEVQRRMRRYIVDYTDDICFTVPFIVSGSLPSPAALTAAADRLACRLSALVPLKPSDVALLPAAGGFTLALSGPAIELEPIAVAYAASEVSNEGITAAPGLSNSGHDVDPSDAPEMTNRFPHLERLLVRSTPQEFECAAPTSRLDATVLVVRWLLHSVPGCKLTGAAVRDFVIRGETPDGIDITVPDDTKVTAIAQQLQSALCCVQSVSVTHNHRSQLSVTLPFGVLDIDILTPSIARQIDAPPYLDASVNGLSVSVSGGLAPKVPLIFDKPFNVTRAIEQCRSKEFDFYLVYANNLSFFRSRLRKLVDRGWTCLTPIPSAVAAHDPTLAKCCPIA